MKPFLIRHLSGNPQRRFPVWMMRQAGRYLPEYRAVRQKHTFWEMVTRPELASEVSLQPLRLLGVDGVILFSDILTLPLGLGLPIEMREGHGPWITQPLKDPSEFEVFRNFVAERHTPYVAQALGLIKKELSDETALLGFAGAPWTVASYLVSPEPEERFRVLMTWAYEKPRDLAKALQQLADATVLYLQQQIQAGTHMVQVFDTWLSEIPYTFLKELYLPILMDMARKISECQVPAAFYTKHVPHLVGDLSQLGFPILSVDSQVPLKEVDRLTHHPVHLQGNLDPRILFMSESIVRRSTRELVGQARELKRPAILNLGHGILPGTPVSNVRAFLDEAKTLWI